MKTFAWFVVCWLVPFVVSVVSLGVAAAVTEHWRASDVGYVMLPLIGFIGLLFTGGLLMLACSCARRPTPRASP